MRIYQLSEQLHLEIANYIDLHYTETALRKMQAECRMPDTLSMDSPREEREFLRPCAPMVSKAISLEEFLEEEDAGFSETLLHLIDNAGKKDSEVYKRAGLTKQHFSKIRNNPNYRPTKPTAIALALALELDVAKTNDLIGRVGYTLSNSSKFDLIIRYFIEQKKYDIVEINIALYEFDQPLLGS